ncbi:4-(cytidine 5'-diphospho)-2-C-methyl-D-erythritol kinase [bacterium]|nr:4-(cytidine 5'-diphospho)-2-C-methyl-D-erythritol kinase [bacterium]
MSHLQVNIKAPAKINLGLNIIGKRTDGYHLIETFFQAVDLYDELCLSPEDSGVHLICDDTDLEIDAGNLAYKAAKKLLEYAAYPKGVRIHLNKHIPVGAGLGGGSSDAAATLKGLLQLYQLDITEADLRKIAGSLGADVPFFLNGPAAFGYGIGDILELSPPLPPFWVVIVKPGFSISTAWAYNKYDSRLTKSRNKIKILKYAIKTADPQRIGKAIFNDLESVCLADFPELIAIKDVLTGLGACGALMSGSGSAVFGLFTDPGQAKEALDYISDYKKSKMEVFLCSTILG